MAECMPANEISEVGGMESNHVVPLTEGSVEKNSSCVSDDVSVGSTCPATTVEENVDRNSSLDNSEDNTVHDDKAQKPDPYLYTKLGDFTSELFKLEIQNLPYFMGYNQLRKLLNNKLMLETHKVKVIGVRNSKIAFATFKNEEARDRALKALTGYVWRGYTLTAKKAGSMVDPMAAKRKAGTSEDISLKRFKTDDGGHMSEQQIIVMMLKDAVTPLWKMTYEEQLKEKERSVQNFLVKLAKCLRKTCKKDFQFRAILEANKKNHAMQCCPMEPIKPSPCTSGYRNKCEFSIGRHLFTKERTVGFRLSQYKKGSMSVAAPDDCINTSSRMLKAVKCFEAYVRQSDKDVYNPETHSGYWRQLTVRTSTKDLLLIIVMHPQQLSEADLEKEMASLKNYFETGDGNSCGATSVYFQLFDKMHANEEDRPSPTHLLGKKNMEESLLGMTFQISPEAFFQINTGGAEVLYKTIIEKVGNASSSTVLDICCGTGTIGLILAKHGAKVIGVDMCSQAIEDARANAELNNVKSIDFVCGKAEDVVSRAIQKSEASEVVAVANPPRAGLHPKVVKIIRGTEKIKKLIYVSCRPESAINNFLDLCRSTSNNFQGEPFYPVEATAVDMFPHTPHYELIFVFERQK